MGIFTLLAICVPFAVVVMIVKFVQWAYRKIVDAIKWRRTKKELSYKRRVMYT